MLSITGSECERKGRGTADALIKRVEIGTVLKIGRNKDEVVSNGNEAIVRIALASRAV